MVNLCAVCHKPLDDGDVVNFYAEGTYHTIKSTHIWAIEKDLIADPATLRHTECLP